MGSGIARASENIYWRTCIQTVEGSVIGRVFLVEGGGCFFLTELNSVSTFLFITYSVAIFLSSVREEDLASLKS